MMMMLMMMKFVSMQSSIPHILQQLRPRDGGEARSVAVVSDAGSPGISDPGAELAAALHEVQIPLHPVAGPSAVVAALSVAGFYASPFTFMGFLPPKGTARSAALRALADTPHAAVLYEAPHRILQTMQQLAEVCGGERECVCGRELTKRHEQIVRGSISAVLQRLRAAADEQVDSEGVGDAIRIRGEFTVVLGPLPSVRMLQKQRKELLSSSALLNSEAAPVQNTDIYLTYADSSSNSGSNSDSHGSSSTRNSSLHPGRGSDRKRLRRKISNSGSTATSVSSIATCAFAATDGDGDSSDEVGRDGAGESGSSHWLRMAQSLFAQQQLNPLEQDLIAQLLRLRDEDKLSRSHAVKVACKLLQLPRSNVYAIALKIPWP